MTCFRAFGLLATLFLLALSFAAPARAGLLQEFTCLPDPDLTCEGTIGFPEPTGTFPPDELTVLEVSGELFGTPFSFDIGDVTSASWELDPNDWSIDSIFLAAVDAGSLVNLFSLQADDETPPTAVANCRGLTDPFRCDPDSGSNVGANANFETVSIPEPATLTLFAGGLAGLLGWAWRRRRSA